MSQALVNDEAISSRCFTPAYMAPEQFIAIDPGDLDIRSDLYSLGVILYELAHPQCRPPFAGSYERLRELHTSVSPLLYPIEHPDLAAIIQRCLEKDPAKRYQRVEELMRDLECGYRHSEMEDQRNVMWQDILTHIERGRLSPARRLCQLILQDDPSWTDAREILDQIQERFQQAQSIYTAMEQGLDRLSLHELNALLNAAVEIFPEHPAGQTVQILLEQKTERYRQAMEEGLTAVLRHEWDEAYSWFEKADRYNPGAIEIVKAKRFVNNIQQTIEPTRRRINLCLDNGDHDRALNLARSVDHYLAKQIPALPSSP